MIWMREIIGQKNLYHLPPDHVANIINLHHKMNIIRARYGKPMIVTSGYRSEEDHRRIYRAKGIENPPMGSQHLRGAAIDIADPDGNFKHWIAENLDVFERLDLYLEAFSATPTWSHIQLYSPRSGNRFFYP